MLFKNFHCFGNWYVYSDCCLEGLREKKRIFFKDIHKRKPLKNISKWRLIFYCCSCTCTKGRGELCILKKKKQEENGRVSLFSIFNGAVNPHEVYRIQSAKLS